MNTKTIIASIATIFALNMACSGGIDWSNTHWINKTTAIMESQSFRGYMGICKDIQMTGKCSKVPKCSECGDTGFTKKMVQIKDMPPQTRALFPYGLSLANTRPVYFQCRTCLASIANEEAKRAAKKKVAKSNSLYNRIGCNSTKGTVAYVEPTNGCPRVLQVIDERRLLVVVEHFPGPKYIVAMVETSEAHNLADDMPMNIPGKYECVGTESYVAVDGSSRTVKKWVQRKI